MLAVQHIYFNLHILKRERERERDGWRDVLLYILCTSYLCSYIDVATCTSICMICFKNLSSLTYQST